MIAENRVPGLLGGVDHVGHLVARVGAVADAGIVEQDVEPAEATFRLGHHLRDVVFARDVDAHAQAADLAGGRGGAVPVDVGDDDLGAVGREQLRRRLALAGGAAGDDGDLARKIEEIECALFHSTRPRCWGQWINVMSRGAEVR